MTLQDKLAELAKEAGLTPEQSQVALVWETPTETIVLFFGDHNQVQEMYSGTGTRH